jgi:hypothetical protein
MPNFSLSALYPTAPLNWISILHYLILMATVYMLVTAGEKTPLLYIIVLGSQALFAAASLYIDQVRLAPLFAFLVRVGMVAVPLVLAGWSPTENTRSAGVMTAILAAPVLAMTFLSCTIPIIGDPRIFNMGWCR